MPNMHDALRCDADILQLDVVAVGEVTGAYNPAAAPAIVVRAVDSAADETATSGQ
jgi:hypothetical protein